MQSFCFGFPLGLVLLQCFVATAAKEVDYGKYGKFSNAPPFDSKVIIVNRPLPAKPEEMQMEYFVFTREDRIGKIKIDDSDANKLQESSYDGAKRTFLIIHGWTGKPLESKWVNTMKDVLLEKEDANVIITGWKEGADDLYYPQAVGNSRLAGAMVAEFIKFLNTQTSNTPETFHVIGFSLGAHVAGYAGKRFQEITDSKIARITGLDPASPGYKGTHIDVRLDATDAEFVDVIHSDCPRVGTPDKSGKFDFWPNGGGSQPGCLIRKKGLVDKIFKLVGCEHYRAHQYFIESIKSTECLFRSYPCQNWNEFTRGKCMECGANGKNCPEMGFNAIKYKDLEGGSFYLNTNSEAPYCVPRYMYVTFGTGTSIFGGGHNPRVRISGSKGNTGEIKFKGELEKGSTEKFLAPVGKDIGELKSVEVKNNRIDPWKVTKVTLQYIDGTDSYHACFNVNVYRSFKKRDLTRGNAQCKRKHSIRGPRNKDRHIGSGEHGEKIVKSTLQKKGRLHKILKNKA